MWNEMIRSWLYWHTFFFFLPCWNCSLIQRLGSDTLSLNTCHHPSFTAEVISAVYITLQDSPTVAFSLTSFCNSLWKCVKVCVCVFGSSEPGWMYAAALSAFLWAANTFAVSLLYVSPSSTQQCISMSRLIFKCVCGFMAASHTHTCISKHLFFFSSSLCNIVVSFPAPSSSLTSFSLSQGPSNDKPYIPP